MDQRYCHRDNATLPGELMGDKFLSPVYKNINKLRLYPDIHKFSQK